MKRVLVVVILLVSVTRISAQLPAEEVYKVNNSSLSAAFSP
jgi:hypothetical protein